MAQTKKQPQQSGQSEGEGSSSGKVNSPSEVIAHAYALIPHKSGKMRAVHLENVVAERVEDLEPSGRPEPGMIGVERVNGAMTSRYRRRAWGK